MIDKNFLKTLTILYIEDDDTTREKLLLVLKRFFKEIITAKNGEEGYIRFHEAEISNNSIDAIISDINMPKMNGIEFLRTIRDHDEHRESVVFMFTTSTQEVDKKNAYLYNVAGYIAKADYKDSLKKVINLIETYRSIIHLP